MFTYNELHDALKNNVVTVTFTKVDGSTRNMRCTLQEKYLPEQFRGKGSLITEGANVIRVFDLDVNQWRSFRVDSVSAMNYNFTNPQTTVALNG